LSRGIAVDDEAGTITFNLRAPDAEFLFKLALPFAYAVPAGTPNRDVGTRPVPATGPYMVAAYKPGRFIRLVRNPRFHVWSDAAQPAGYPDNIVPLSTKSLGEMFVDMTENLFVFHAFVLCYVDFKDTTPYCLGSCPELVQLNER